MENSFVEELGRALETAGLSQRKAAELIGVNHFSVGRWISGKAVPTRANQARILRLLADITRSGHENILMTREPDPRLYDVRCTVKMYGGGEPVPVRREDALMLFKTSDESRWLAFQVHGKEMIPFLADGAIAFVRTGDRVSDGIILIDIDGVAALRMVQRLPGKRLRLSTPGGAHKPLEVSEDEINVIGRVVAKIDSV